MSRRASAALRNLDLAAGGLLLGALVVAYVSLYRPLEHTYGYYFDLRQQRDAADAALTADRESLIAAQDSMAALEAAAAARLAAAPREDQLNEILNDMLHHADKLGIHVHTFEPKDRRSEQLDVAVRVELRGAATPQSLLQFLTWLDRVHPYHAIHALSMSRGAQGQCTIQVLFELRLLRYEQVAEESTA